MFRSVGRFLLAAKTSVKEPIKVRPGAKKEEEKPTRKVIDTTKWHHNKWPGNHMFHLIQALPQPKKDAPRSTWLHKGGFGLKFYRPLWVRYVEPCYWTVAKYKPPQNGRPGRVWGFKTWRGVTEPLPRRIPGVHRKQWRILLEPGTQLGLSKDECWTAPEVTLTSDPKLCTQLPEDLPGAPKDAWPYPWGKLGTRNFPVSEVTRALQEEEADAEAQQREEIDEQMEEDRAVFLDAPQVVVEVDEQGRLFETFDDSEAEDEFEHDQLEEGEEEEGEVEAADKAAAPASASASGVEVSVDGDVADPNEAVLFDLDSIQIDQSGVDEDDVWDDVEEEEARLNQEAEEEEETMQQLDDAADAEEEAERKDDAKRDAEAKKPTTQ